jgi:hypothetical protein
MGEPVPDGEPEWMWRLRRSSTRPSDGTTFMVHEATRTDWAARVQHAVHRHEVWDADGTLRTTFVRRHRNRWWSRDELVALLEGAGLVDVEARGPEGLFLAVGVRPG